MFIQHQYPVLTETHEETQNILLQTIIKRTYKK